MKKFSPGSTHGAMIKQSSVTYQKTHKEMIVPTHEMLRAWMAQCIFDRNVVPMTTYDAKAASLAVTIKES